MMVYTVRRGATFFYDVQLVLHERGQDLFTRTLTHVHSRSNNPVSVGSETGRIAALPLSVCHLVILIFTTQRTGTRWGVDGCSLTVSTDGVCVCVCVCKNGFIIETI